MGSFGFFFAVVSTLREGFLALINIRMNTFFCVWILAICNDVVISQITNQMLKVR